MIYRNCGAANCPGNALPMEDYCAMHMMDARQTRPHKVVYVDQYKSTFPKYGNKPENSKNKL